MWDEEGRSARAVRVSVVAKGFSASAFTPSRSNDFADERGAARPRANNVVNVSDATNPRKGGGPMAERIVIEEYHLTVLVPRGLLESEAEAIRLTLADPAFEGRLRRAVRRIFRGTGSLEKVKVRLSR